jgi:hypothetical protein
MEKQCEGKLAEGLGADRCLSGDVLTMTVVIAIVRWCTFRHDVSMAVAEESSRHVALVVYTSTVVERSSRQQRVETLVWEHWPAWIFPPTDRRLGGGVRQSNPIGKPIPVSFRVRGGGRARRRCHHYHADPPHPGINPFYSKGPAFIPDEESATRDRGSPITHTSTAKVSSVPTRSLRTACKAKQKPWR